MIKDYITTKERLREPSFHEIQVMKAKLVPYENNRLWKWIFGRTK